MSRYAKDVNKYLTLIQQNDFSLFDNLVYLTANHLLAVAKTYLINKDYAEDVVSETYIKVIKNIRSFDSTKDGYNWMLKIVQNVSITYNSKLLSSTELTRALACNALPQEYEENFDNLNFFFEIDKLEKTDKIIAYKRFYLDESQDKIGKELQLSKAAVCKRIKKICKVIQKSYASKEQ